jgi:hypothetical protein
MVMQNLYQDMSTFAASGFEPQMIDEARRWNERIDAFMASPLGCHLRSVDTVATPNESGGYLLGTKDIQDEIQPGAAPCGYLFPYGYLPVWSSIGGNVVVYCLGDGSFYWADHISFSEDRITIPVTYEEIPFSEENIKKGLILVSREPTDKFLARLLRGEYRNQLDGLD